MTNINAPFGFAEARRLGAAVNSQLSRRWISPANATPIYFGDPVVQLSTGYLAQAAGGTSTVQIGGIFAGCSYMSISKKTIVESPFWPGSDAVSTINVAARIVDDPLTVFRVQANGLLTFTMIGANATFIAGAGNTANGYSTAALDVVTTVPDTNAGKPFRILDLITDPPGAPGTDITSAYNWAYVTFNNQDFKSLTGI